ncbi:MAG TPA: poly(3-hydroxybutyrate) depolymerase [Chryseolinea sp.]|nr:poly(3-hydroxybutyrate) depolymerase [Chryseolinea sp.]HPM30955.1 poly(3-hydroxybutyrate) depolymerase [Chryseolinea sp.]
MNSIKRLSLLLIPIALLLSLGASAQVITDSLLIDNHYRTFNFAKPNVKPNASLVFVLHGSGGNGKGMMNNTTHLAENVSSENVVLVYPDGYKKFWNECRKLADSEANHLDIDEASFFNSMIQYFKSKYSINEQQVFAVGTSGGGQMCYKLALTMPGKFKAVAIIIANLPDTDNMDCGEAHVALPIMIVNGTEDPLNHYNGGMMQMGNIVLGNVRSTDRTFQYWSELAGYTGEPKKQLIPDTDPSDGKTIERYTYKQKGKPEVVLFKVIGGKHDYPNDIDVHVEAWNFFKRQLN